MTNKIKAIHIDAIGATYCVGYPYSTYGYKGKMVKITSICEYSDNISTCEIAAEDYFSPAKNANRQGVFYAIYAGKEIWQIVPKKDARVEYFIKQEKDIAGDEEE